MALRNLVLEGDPLLRKTSRPVDEITPRIIKLLDDMADTMYYGGRGIGIAAPQVGVLRRVFIVDVGDEHGLIEFINPEILEASGSQTDNEGCLSVPGKTCEVERPSHIKVKATDRNGNEFELEADGLLARCICHENDHLNGVLFIDKSVDGKIYNTSDVED
ncbi:MAG: peptide deformylase [Clostridiales bacterium]|jgi:peptide deformylase|nr:peptide deformylase [Clostridiales bacterium]MBQ1744897.1 peptide deformylase [Clostridiales bacterium]MBQ2155903.1 peptide deformylase [Clostridiales bacterium]MBQ5520274.1 peptide deformylase [Clostridiales bacterium]MBR3700741.1 peptide deformylase [Clostridiales bacterium]